MSAERNINGLACPPGPVPNFLSLTVATISRNQAAYPHQPIFSSSAPMDLVQSSSAPVHSARPSSSSVEPLTMESGLSSAQLPSSSSPVLPPALVQAFPSSVATAGPAQPKHNVRPPLRFPFVSPSAEMLLQGSARVLRIGPSGAAVGGSEDLATPTFISPLLGKICSRLPGYPCWRTCHWPRFPTQWDLWNSRISWMSAWPRRRPKPFMGLPL